MYSTKESDNGPVIVPMYQNDLLATQFDAYISGVNTISAYGSSDIYFNGDEIGVKNEEGGELVIHSLDGMVVKQIVLSGESEISVADLPTGIYIATYRSADRTSALRIVVR